MSSTSDAATAPIAITSAAALHESDGWLVRTLLHRAFLRLGNPRAEEDAKVYQGRLADDLQIHTALQLMTSLSKSQPKDSRRLAEVRALLKESLLEALQDEAAGLTKSATTFLPPMMKPRKVRLEISRVDILQVSDINQKGQSFDMELFVQGTFIDGARDEALHSASDVFPLDVVGRPTFRPSAQWFLNQADFTTAVKPLQTRMSSVVAAGPHLQLNKKIKGSFFDEFDGLAAFPFDQQRLTVKFTLNCANEGATPIELAFAKDLAPFVVDQGDFADRNAWIIANEVDLEISTVGISASRRFPALAISINVYRRPFFFLVNIALPAGTFALLGVFILLLPVNYPPSRASYLLTLTLTLVAYKLSTNTHMPTVTYLTTMDRYQLWNAAIVLFVVFETVALAAWMHWFGAAPAEAAWTAAEGLPMEAAWTADAEAAAASRANDVDHDADLVDRACQGVAALAWLVLHGWFLRHMIRTSRRHGSVQREASVYTKHTTRRGMSEHTLRTPLAGAGDAPSAPPLPAPNSAATVPLLSAAASPAPATSSPASGRS